MDVISIILVVSMYPFILIMYFGLKSEGHEPRKGVYYGVSLDKEQAKAPEIQQITTEYNQLMKKFLWITLLMSIPMFFIPWFSINLTYWCVWMLVICVIFFIPFGIANKKLKELKHQKGWSTGEEQPSFTEIKEAGRIRKVKWYHFLLPVLISVGIFVWTLLRPDDGREALLVIMAGTFGSMTFMFWGLAVWMDKEKTGIVSTDSDVNVNYARARKNMWKNFWVFCAWLNVIYMGAMLFCLVQEEGLSVAFWLLTGLYTLATIVLFIWLMRKNTALEKCYEDKMDIKIQDDDSHWIWGMFYYNPKDKHSMVNKRVGLGTTVNLATALGKGTVILVVVALLSLPVMCVWVTLEEFTPIRLVVEENQVIARHLKENHNISLDTVVDAELLTELPKMSRNHGTSMDHLRKGSYRVKEEGVSCEVFCNPQNNLFIRVETEEEIYLFSGFDDEETRQVYETIIK